MSVVGARVSRPGSGATRRVLLVAGAAVLIAAITAATFLVRAGDPWSGNWPVDFELHTSDNGVLFQFAQDLLGGRPLDWRFSPQVYVFPEIPISLLAYVLAGGTLQVYYVLVASLNAALVFLALVVVIRYLFPDQGSALRIGRAFVAILPILLLPLLGSTPLFEYPLAPTYYFGMYLMILAVPITFLARARWVRIAVGVAFVLTAASNPLVLVFTVPALVCVGIALGLSGGFRLLVRPAMWAAAIVAATLLIRVFLFARLQGTSPLSYVNWSVFDGRMQAIVTTLRGLFAANAAAAAIVVLGAALLLTGAVVGIVVVIRMIRSRGPGDARRAAFIYYALAPATGLAGTLVLLITDYLYLWPVLVLPLVLALLALPTGWVQPGAGLAAGALLLVGAVTGGAVNIGNSGEYFSYRLAETRCLDSELPVGMTVGYATFSDARPIELTSTRGIRLIQLKSSGVRAYWLTNRDYARDNVGKFFFINHHGGEPAISVRYIESHFGKPDSTFGCAPGQTVLVYTAPSKLAKIKARYSTLPAP